MAVGPSPTPRLFYWFGILILSLFCMVFRTTITTDLFLSVSSSSSSCNYEDGNNLFVVERAPSTAGTRSIGSSPDTENGVGGILSNEAMEGAEDTDDDDQDNWKRQAGRFQGQKYNYIHVGKTAGSKIACELSFGYPPTCKRFPKDRRSALVQHRGGAFHMFFSKEWDTNPDGTIYIFSIRHPLERLRSWFHYENIRNEWVRKQRQVKNGKSCANKFHKYNDEWTPNGCFSTLDDFATNCLPAYNRSSANLNCQRLAWDVARGKKPCISHNSFNYEYYVRKMINELITPNITEYHILVMRAEHVAEDWDMIESMFGGNSTKGSSTFTKILNNSTREEDYLSDQGLINLCLALCDDIQHYKWLLLRAENLSRRQRDESFAELRTLCPKETNGIQQCERDYLK